MPDTFVRVVGKQIRLSDNGDGTFSLATAGGGALAAGENHIGEIGGNSELIEVTPTISTSAYTAGDSLGGKWTLSAALRAAGKPVVLQSVLLLDKDNQKPEGQLLLFRADPSAATLTDNAALALSTNDEDVIAMIDVTSEDWKTIDSKAYAALRGLGEVLEASSGTTLYAAFVVTSTPTFAATDSLVAKFGLLRD